MEYMMGGREGRKDGVYDGRDGRMEYMMGGRERVHGGREGVY